MCGYRRSLKLRQLTVLVLDLLVIRLNDPVMADRAIRLFGENVRVARKARGWTQEELAEKTGLAAVQVSRIERGVREVRITTLLRLLKAFELPPEALLRGLY
jgi:DNA-binding XRE family transcriptional regulator